MSDPDLLQKIREDCKLGLFSREKLISKIIPEALQYFLNDTFKLQEQKNPAT